MFHNGGSSPLISLTFSGPRLRIYDVSERNLFSLRAMRYEKNGGVDLLIHREYRHHFFTVVVIEQ